MPESKRVLWGIAALAVVAVVLSGASLVMGRTALPPAAEPPKDRVVWMEAVEYKGSTEVAKLAPPETNPETLGASFEFEWVQPGTKWQVSAYAFSPSTIIVNQGDKVTLRIFGVNGNQHTISIQGYQENPVTLQRGRLIDIQFTADKPGMFRIVCHNHEPGMTGWLIVLPRA